MNQKKIKEQKIFRSILTRMTIEEILNAVVSSRSGMDSLDEVPSDIVLEFQHLDEFLTENEEAKYPPYWLVTEEFNTQRENIILNAKILQNVVQWSESYFSTLAEENKELMFNSDGTLVDNKKDSSLEYPIGDSVSNLRKQIARAIINNEELLQQLNLVLHKRGWEASNSEDQNLNKQDYINFHQKLSNYSVEEVFWMLNNFWFGHEDFESYLPIDIIIAFEHLEKWLEQNQKD